MPGVETLFNFEVRAQLEGRSIYAFRPGTDYGSRHVGLGLLAHNKKATQPASCGGLEKRPLAH